MNYEPKLILFSNNSATVIWADSKKICFLDHAKDFRSFFFRQPISYWHER